MFTDMFNKKSLTKQYIKAIHFLVSPPKALYTLGRAQKRLKRGSMGKEVIEKTKHDTIAVLLYCS